MKIMVTGGAGFIGSAVVRYIDRVKRNPASRSLLESEIDTLASLFLNLTAVGQEYGNEHKQLKSHLRKNYKHSFVAESVYISLKLI